MSAAFGITRVELLYKVFAYARELFSDCSAMHVDTAHCRTADSENLFIASLAFFQMICVSETNIFKADSL